MNEPVTRNENSGVEQWLESRREELFALLPGNIQKERFLRNLIMQIKMNSCLKNCSIASIAKACVQASTLGLDIGVLGSAYLVPYGSEAQLSVGYQGYIDLAYRSGMKAIHTGLVREKDEYRAKEDTFTHEYDPFLPDRGPVVGVYCLVDLPTGARYSELMTAQEVEEIRAGSRSANSPAWRDHWGEMAKKVVIRRALKRAPLSVETKEVIQFSDNAEYGYTNQETKRGRDGLRDSLIRESLKAKTAVPPVLSAPQVKTEKVGETSAPKEIAKPFSLEQWDIHLEKANELAREMGPPMKRWNKITASRQALIKERMNTEGYEPSQIGEFWNFTKNNFLPFDGSKVEGWESSCTLDIMIRIPKRGGTDHYQKAAEGGYKNKQAMPAEPEAFSIKQMKENVE